MVKAVAYVVLPEAREPTIGPVTSSSRSWTLDSALRKSYSARERREQAKPCEATPCNATRHTSDLQSQACGVARGGLGAVEQWSLAEPVRSFRSRQ